MDVAMSTVEYYYDDQGYLLAMLIPSDYSGSGIEFFTDSNSFFQVASMVHPSGHIIQPHYHNSIDRTVSTTSEAIILRKGELFVRLFDSGNRKTHSFVIEEGDILLLLSGGHGFDAIADVEMIEIKQGPFLGDCDKTRFEYQGDGNESSR